jgi:excisionase family DNA binding protein
MSDNSKTILPDGPWTIEQVAEYLQLSPRTVESRIKDAGLPCSRVGGVRRFVRAEVDAWLRQQAA